MGKTEKGTIWLDADRTSPYAFYQYWKNIDDRDVMTCVHYLTEIPRQEAESMAETMKTDPRAPKQRLAEWLTEFVHGKAGLESALRASAMLFSGGEIAELRDAQVMEIFADVPSLELPKARLSEGLPLVDALVESKLAASKSEARRTIEQGGAYVNNHPATQIDRKLTESDLASESVIVLRSGKKKYALLRFV
jgi:tyrosyl-tRNA synthetase